MPIATLASVSLDCPDPAVLAAFYAAVTGLEISYETDTFAAIGGDPLYVAFVRVDDHRPPTWPEGDVPQQFHLDFKVDDVAAAVDQVMALGASKPAHQPGGDRWTVLADPAGHPFCLTTM